MIKRFDRELVAKNRNNPNFLALVFISALALFAKNSISYAQDTSNYWVNAGLGLGAFDSRLAGSTGISLLSYQTGIRIVSIRNNIEVSIVLFGHSPSPEESVWDIGILYGIIAKGSYGSASISGGVSLVGGIRRGKPLPGSSYRYEELSFKTVGIPIEAQLFFTPFSFLGVGFYGFANLNLEKSFWGALLCLQVGKLK